MKLKDWFTKSQPPSAERTGESMADAVVITAPNTSAGLAMEYQLLSRTFGTRGVDWELERQELRHKGRRHYDIMTVKTRDGQTRSIWFDITAFYGKV